MRQPSPQSALAAALNPVETGSVAGVAPATVKLARFQMAVSTVRGLAIGLLLLTLLILFTKPHEGASARSGRSSARIAHRYGCIVVDVVSIADGALAAGAPTAHPGLREPRDARRGTASARSSASRARTATPTASRTADASTSTAPSPRHGRRRVRPVAPPVTAAACQARAPRSPVARPLRRGDTAARRRRHVRRGVHEREHGSGQLCGASNKPVALSQLAPSQCSGMTLANQITMTTNSTAGTVAATSSSAGMSRRP